MCCASGIERRDISYVEAHGTGTVVGDAQELAAIDFVYGSGAGRSAADPLLIGSVKSNMGHCEGCSGLAGGQWAVPMGSARAWLVLAPVLVHVHG